MPFRTGALARTNWLPDDPEQRAPGSQFRQVFHPERTRYVGRRPAVHRPSLSDSRQFWIPDGDTYRNNCLLGCRGLEGTAVWKLGAVGNVNRSNESEYSLCG